MNKNKSFEKILQEIITDEEIERISKKYGYIEKGRKMLVKTLFQYFLLSAFLETKSMRELHKQGSMYGLPAVDYSTISKKAKEVPFMIFIELFYIIFSNCNQQNKRKIRSKCGRILKIIDSTRIIESKSKWDWGFYKEDKSGIKFHVAYLPDSGVPEQIIATPINIGDSTLLDKFDEPDTLLLCDRGYLNIGKMCEFDYKGQEFIIRMREGINQLNCIDFDIAHSTKYSDMLCTLGKDRSIKSEYRNHQFRVINFKTDAGDLVSLCTNIMDLSADEIADLYKRRWEIEVFFKELKQNFTIKTIFGKSQNSAFSQGVIAFICYMILSCLYHSLEYSKAKSSPFLIFLRDFRYNCLLCHGNKFNAVFRSLFS